MKMGFHERQKKVLESRVDKEIRGKQEKMDKEISPCTFKPSMLAKSRYNVSAKIHIQERPSYLQHYYERLSRKY